MSRAPGPRVLLLGPVFPSGHGGGLAVALDSLQQSLRRHGWLVDRPVVSAEGRVPTLPALDGAGMLGAGLQWAWAAELQRRTPRRLRRWLIELSRPPAFYRRASAHLRETEARLRAGREDVVLACPQRLPPGLLDLAANLHPRVICVTLDGLADELRHQRLWAAQRTLARAHLGTACHPSLGRPVTACRVAHVVAASQAWHRDAVQAGMPSGRVSTIYFGVPSGARQPRPLWSDRLLWVGRLAPEKGLHHLLAAMPLLRSRLPGSTLTAIAAPGPPAYARLIGRTLRAGRQPGVTLVPPRPRPALTEAYCRHDALIFFSVFDEPVALTVLEAFAAGLPVIASRPAVVDGPVRDGETCLCFDPADPASLACAVARLRRDETLRARLCARARDLVEAEFSLDAMGRAYDRLLREVLASPAASRVGQA